ncbi:MAG: carboxypeptidase-like regulatory domain-containing protein, partial [Marinoscillum sp.]
MKKLVLLIFILSSIFIDLFSQNVISGIIQEDGSGERLSYSNVYIDEIKIGSSANENGYFTLVGDIKEGMTLKASYVGYKTKSITLTSEMINNDFEINLAVLTSPFNEVVVSAESSKFL